MRQTSLILEIPGADRALIERGLAAAHAVLAAAGVGPAVAEAASHNLSATEEGFFEETPSMRKGARAWFEAEKAAFSVVCGEALPPDGARLRSGLS